MTSTAAPQIGTTVTFRPDFSAKLVGVEFIVDLHCVTPGMVGLKRQTAGRWGYRLAYVSDLVAL